MVIRANVRFRISFISMTALLLCIQAPAQDRVNSDSKKYNVLFIAVDDLNTDLGCYGSSVVKSPHIDALAKNVVLFNRAYSQYPHCSPSRASLLTGYKPDVTKVYNGDPDFRKTVPDVVTLPQLFKNNGYETVRLGKIFHYGVPNQIGTNGADDAASWSHVINPKGRDVSEKSKVIKLTPDRQMGSALAYHEADGKDGEQTDGIMATEAIRMLGRLKEQDKPFFLAVGFFRPHTPYVAPKKYFDLYTEEDIIIPAFDLEDVPSDALFTKPANWGLSQDKLVAAKRGYYATVSFIDAQVGRVVDALKELGLADNTIIVLWSDHGYNLGEHGQWMKQSLFEKAVRVPLLFACPGNPPHIVDTPVELLDIYPTLAELAGLQPTQKLDGKSLVPLLKNNTITDEKAAAFSQTKRGDRMGRSVRTKRWRYTEWDEGRSGVELYDHAVDDQELTNLAKDPEFKEIMSTLSKKLGDYYHSL